jgi:NADH dehydrogenase [ubiquinone] 1 alpha subcomplex assembly factor 7
VEQGLFLETLGIVQRAAKLKEAGGVEIDAALQRLTAQDEMGTLFKVMALTAEDMPLPGFVA